MKLSTSKLSTQDVYDVGSFAVVTMRIVTFERRVKFLRTTSVKLFRWVQSKIADIMKTMFALTCSETLLTPKFIIEIIENHSEFYGSAKSRNKFVSSRSWQTMNQTWGNRNRLDWPKMKCNRNGSHCQFNRNRRLLSRLNLESFTLHQCATNCGCGGWVSPLSSFVMVTFQGRLVARLCALKSRQYRGKHSVWS